mgnify:CR=1 FL=1
MQSPLTIVGLLVLAAQSICAAETLRYATTVQHTRRGEVRLAADPAKVRPRANLVRPGFIGNLGEGSTTDTIWNNGAWINASGFKADTDINATTIWAKVGQVAGTYQCAIYLAQEDDAKLLQATAAVAKPTDGWHPFPLTSPVALKKDQRYWLAIWSDDPKARVYADEGGTTKWARQDFGAWPTALKFADGNNLRFSIYAASSPERILPLPLPPKAASITVDGGKTLQTVAGFGANVNYLGWNEKELQSVLNWMVDDAGWTHFRVAFDNADWETVNDNDDPKVMAAAAYQKIYNSPRFARLWDFLAALNRKGIKGEGITLCFMGWGPEWLGGEVLTPGLEEEWAEMVASAVLHARRERKLDFQLLAPTNEPDVRREGIHMPPVQYVLALRKLAQQLDACGLNDIRLVAPDTAGPGGAYKAAMVADPVVMAKLAHWGDHDYSLGGASRGSADFIRQSRFSNLDFWMTEFNVLCHGCNDGRRGTYDWKYGRGTAQYLLEHLCNGATAAQVWEGYDSYYAHHKAWGFWGVIGLDDEKAPSKTYSPRPSFHALAQLTKYLRPGARRIEVAGAIEPLSHLLAFHDSKARSFTLLGVNPAPNPVMLGGALESLPGLAQLELHFTSASTNLASGGKYPVVNHAFSITIPADCVFAVTGSAADR